MCSSKPKSLPARVRLWAGGAAVAAQPDLASIYDPRREAGDRLDAWVQRSRFRGCFLVEAPGLVSFRLKPQKREFFALFTKASANAREIARLLVELLEGWPESRAILVAIRDGEHAGDQLTRELISLLNRTFVTPFDRDDMYRLATVIDDICDYVDEAADNIDAYEVVAVPLKALEQAGVVYRSASRLHEAVELLEGFQDSHRQLIAVRELEDEGDRLARDAIADLFSREHDPLMV